MSTCGCSDAPSLNVLGSFFPSWMLCALGGLLLAAVLGQLLGVVGIAQHLPLPALSFAAAAASFSFLLWLVWLG